MDAHIAAAAERVTMAAVATSYAFGRMGQTAAKAAATGSPASAAAAKLLPADRDVREAQRRLRAAETLLSKFPRYRADDYAVEESDVRTSLVLNTSESQFRIDKAFSWLLSLIIGVLNGIVGFLFTQGINWLNRAKFSTTLGFIRPGGSAAAAYLVYLAFSVLYSAGGALLGSYVSPQAAGSGLPEIRCYLNGIHVRGLLTVRTFFAKSLGVVLSVASGLLVGKEGPFTQVGAILGGGVARLGSTSLTRATRGQLRAALHTRFGSYFKSAVSHRDYVAAGAAAGVASAFGAPLGGILFAVEQGASFYNHNMLSHAFLSAGIAVYVGALLAAALSQGPSLYKTAMTTQQTFVLLREVPDNTRLWYYSWELPVFAAMGLLGGLLGAAMVVLNDAVTRLRRRFIPPTRPARRVAEVVALAALTATTWFLAALLSPCSVYPPKHLLINNLGGTSALGDPVVLFGGQYPQLWCPDGHFSEFGMLFFMPQMTSITMLFQYQLQRPSGAFFIHNISALACLFTLGWLFMTVTFGIGAVTGLFVPSLLVGGAGGRLMGRLVRHVMLRLGYQRDDGTGVINICLSAYAIVGASSVLGGVSRMLLCNTVLVMETAAASALIMPLIVSTFIAKVVADMLTPVGIFDAAIERAGYPYLESEPGDLTDIKLQHALTAGDVMSSGLATLPAVLSVGQLVARLRRYPNFSTFPVTEPSGRPGAPEDGAEDCPGCGGEGAECEGAECEGAEGDDRCRAAAGGRRPDGMAPSPLRPAATTTATATGTATGTHTGIGTAASACAGSPSPPAALPPPGALPAASKPTPAFNRESAEARAVAVPVPLTHGSTPGYRAPKPPRPTFVDFEPLAATPSAHSTRSSRITSGADSASEPDAHDAPHAAFAPTAGLTAPSLSQPPSPASRHHSLHVPPYLQPPVGSTFRSAFVGGLAATMAAAAAVPPAVPAGRLQVVDWQEGHRLNAGGGGGSSRLASTSAPLSAKVSTSTTPSPLPAAFGRATSASSPACGSAQVHAAAEALDGDMAAAAVAAPDADSPPGATPTAGGTGQPASDADAGGDSGAIIIGTISRTVLLKLLELQLELNEAREAGSGAAVSANGDGGGDGGVWQDANRHGESEGNGGGAVGIPSWFSRRRAAMSRRRAARLLDRLDNYPAKAPGDLQGEEALFSRLGPLELAGVLDLRHYMQRVPYIVPATASLARTYRLFRGLGLHHIFVTAPHIPIVGLITRPDLAPANAFRVAYRLAQREQQQLQALVAQGESQAGAGGGRGADGRGGAEGGGKAAGARCSALKQGEQQRQGQGASSMTQLVYRASFDRAVQTCVRPTLLQQQQRRPAEQPPPFQTSSQGPRGGSGDVSDGGSGGGDRERRHADATAATTSGGGGDGGATGPPSSAGGDTLAADRSPSLGPQLPPQPPEAGSAGGGTHSPPLPAAASRPSDDGRSSAAAAAAAAAQTTAPSPPEQQTYSGRRRRRPLFQNSDDGSPRKPAEIAGGGGEIKIALAMPSGLGAQQRAQGEAPLPVDGDGIGDRRVFLERDVRHTQLDTVRGDREAANGGYADDCSGRVRGGGTAGGLRCRAGLASGAALEAMKLGAAVGFSGSPSQRGLRRRVREGLQAGGGGGAAWATPGLAAPVPLDSLLGAAAPVLPTYDPAWRVAAPFSALVYGSSRGGGGGGGGCGMVPRRATAPAAVEGEGGASAGSRISAVEDAEEAEVLQPARSIKRGAEGGAVSQHIRDSGGGGGDVEAPPLQASPRHGVGDQPQTASAPLAPYTSPQRRSRGLASDAARSIRKTAATTARAADADSGPDALRQDTAPAEAEAGSDSPSVPQPPQLLQAVLTRLSRWAPASPRWGPLGADAVEPRLPAPAPPVESLLAATFLAPPPQQQQPSELARAGAAAPWAPVAVQPRAAAISGGDDGDGDPRGNS